MYVLIELEKTLGFTSGVIKDDKLYSEIDVSRHGSPSYVYNLISEDSFDIAMFQSLKIVINYLKSKSK